MKIIKLVKYDYTKLFIYKMLHNIVRLISIMGLIGTFTSIIFFIAIDFDFNAIRVFNAYFYLFIFLIFITPLIYLLEFIVKIIQFNEITSNLVLLKSKLANSRFVHIYYLYILKSNHMLTDDEFETKKSHLLGKTYFSADNFYLLAKYKDYLEISDVDYKHKKQEFLSNDDSISIFELRRLIKIDAITKNEAQTKKLNYNHYYLAFTIGYVLFGIYFLVVS